MIPPTAGLANLWHECPKWQAERFPWYAEFTAVPFFFFFLPGQHRYIVIYIYIYICICTHIYSYIHTQTYLTAYRMYMNYRCYQITLRMKHFYNIDSRTKCWLDVYHWGAGLAVTGRVHDSGQNVLQYSFQTGSSSSPSYIQIVFLIAFLEETFFLEIQ